MWTEKTVGDSEHTEAHDFSLPLPLSYSHWRLRGKTGETVDWQIQKYFKSRKWRNGRWSGKCKHIEGITHKKKRTIVRFSDDRHSNAAISISSPYRTASPSSLSIVPDMASSPIVLYFWSIPMAVILKYIQLTQTESGDSSLSNHLDMVMERMTNHKVSEYPFDHSLWLVVLKLAVSGKWIAPEIL